VNSNRILKGGYMDKKRKIIIFIVIFLVIILYFLIKLVKKPNPNEISGSGTIEITEVDISSKLTGIVEKITVNEGDEVKKGDLLVILTHNELKAQLKQAEASLNASKEQVSQIEAQYKNSLENYKRAVELFKAGSYSIQQKDLAETQYNVISSQLNSAKELVNQAQAQVEYIKVQIDNAYLKSPIDGVVLQKNVEVGEIVTPGMSILTIGNIKEAWLKIYVSEKELGRIKLNDIALIKVDSFPNKSFKGYVTNISNQAEFTPKNVQTKDERDRLVYAIKISLKNENQELKAGMPADAIVYVKSN